MPKSHWGGNSRRRPTDSGRSVSLWSSKPAHSASKLNYHFTVLASLFFSPFFDHPPDWSLLQIGEVGERCKNQPGEIWGDHPRVVDSQSEGDPLGGAGGAENPGKAVCVSQRGQKETHKWTTTGTSNYLHSFRAAYQHSYLKFFFVVYPVNRSRRLETITLFGTWKKRQRSWAWW